MAKMNYQSRTIRKSNLKDLYAHYKNNLTMPERIYARLRLKIILIDEYLKLLSSDNRILSLGCGYGFAEYYFAADSPSRYLLGIDNDPKKIKIAKSSSRHLKNIDYRCLDVKEIEKLGAEGWNVVIAHDLFHHIDYKSQDKVVDRVSHLLKKGGTFIIKDVDPTPSFRKFYNTFHDKVFNKAANIYYRNIEGYKNLIAKNSLKLNLIKHFHTFLFAHIFIVSKKN